MFSASIQRNSKTFTKKIVHCQSSRFWPLLSWCIITFVANTPSLAQVANSPASQVLTWTRLSTTGGPSANNGASLVYDPSSNRTIMFGGVIPTHPQDPCCTSVNDVWVLTNANGTGGTPSWIQLSPATPNGAPSPRSFHSAIYDVAHNIMTIFGGGLAGCGTFCPLYNDIWVLTNANGIGGIPTWIPLSPSGDLPAPREGHTAAYDPVNNRMIVFGGGDNGIMSVPNDLWVLTNADGLGGSPAWLQLTQAGQVPSPIERFAAGYDPSSNRLTIFGGCCFWTNNTWLLENANGVSGVPSWSQIIPSDAPPDIREVHAYGYDPSLDELIIFGFGASNLLYNDTWALTAANGLGAISNWTNLIPNNTAGSPPVPYFAADPGVYDPLTSRLMLNKAESNSQGGFSIVPWVLVVTPGLIFFDPTTTYNLGIEPMSAPCQGTCDLSPPYNRYVVSAPFKISKITFNWKNSGGNNCDGVGNYAAIISTTNDATGTLATSSNSVYLGCAGFGRSPNSGTGELDFSSQTIPASFYLDFATVDGAVQGGANISVSNVEIWQSVPEGASAITITPSFLVFPVQPVNLTTAPLTAIVTNSGNALLDISATPTITGFNFSDFAIASGTTCVAGATIAPGSSCQINITFTPISDSAESALLLLKDNTNGSPQTISLSGGAALAGMLPNPISGSNKSQNVTLTGINFADGVTLNWQNLTNGGPDPVAPVAPFSITSTTVSANMNFMDTTATWQVQATEPDGTKSNWFSFQVLASPGSPYRYQNDYPFQNANHCPSASPSAKCSANTIDPYGFFFRECTSFIAWRINRDVRTPDPRHSSFLNGPNKKLGRNNCKSSNHWGNASNWACYAEFLGYAVDSNPKVGAIAQWTDSCGGKCSTGHVAYVEAVNSDASIDVSEYNYASDDNKVPTIQGDHQFGIRTIARNSPLFPQNFIHILSLVPSTSSLSFENQAVSSPSELSVTFANPGTETISITKISIEGKDNADFSETDTCAPSVLANGFCRVTVTFNPSAPGSRSASLIVSGTAGPIILSLTGTGLSPLAVSPEKLSFPGIHAGTSTSKNIILTNRTGTDISISASALSGSSAFEQLSSTCGATLKWKSTCKMVIAFSPPAKGKYSGILTISSSAINSPQIVNLSGTGTSP